MTELTAETLPRDPEAGRRNVYFIYCSGFIKIGMSFTPARRLKEIRVGTPWNAEVVLLIPGGRLTEDYFHFIFKADHFRGEWFFLSPAIRSFIEKKAPDYVLKWLVEEETVYRDWVEHQAKQMGLLIEDRKVISIWPGARAGRPQERDNGEARAKFRLNIPAAE